jgi:hypothetical protein
MYEERELLQRQAAPMIALPVPRCKIGRLRAIHADQEAAIAPSIPSSPGRAAMSSYGARRSGPMEIPISATSRLFQDGKLISWQRATRSW